MDFGTEAALYPEKEYINGFFVAVQERGLLICRQVKKGVGDMVMMRGK